MCLVGRTLTGLDYDFISMHFTILVNYDVKYGRHRYHVCGTNILEAKGHQSVMIYIPRCNEGRLFFIFLIYQNFVMACVTIQKLQHLVLSTIVNQNMNILQRKIILRASFVEISVVDTNLDFPIFFGDQNNIGQPS